MQRERERIIVFDANFRHGGIFVQTRLSLTTATPSHATCFQNSVFSDSGKPEKNNEAVQVFAATYLPSFQGILINVACIKKRDGMYKCIRVCVWLRESGCMSEKVR